MNNGYHIKLRVFREHREAWDIVAEDGRVEPKALNPKTYVGPNGATMRANTPYQQSLLTTRLRGQDVLVYAVPKGVVLPDDLILVQEGSDRWSLQPAKEMSMSDLNHKMSDFFWKEARVYSRNEWIKEYPWATEFPFVPAGKKDWGPR